MLQVLRGRNTVGHAHFALPNWPLSGAPGPVSGPSRSSNVGSSQPVGRCSIAGPLPPVQVSQMIVLWPASSVMHLSMYCPWPQVPPHGQRVGIWPYMKSIASPLEQILWSNAPIRTVYFRPIICKYWSNPPNLGHVYWSNEIKSPPFASRDNTLIGALVSRASPMPPYCKLINNDAIAIIHYHWGLA